MGAPVGHPGNPRGAARASRRRVRFDMRGNVPKRVRTFAVKAHVEAEGGLGPTPPSVHFSTGSDLIAGVLLWGCHIMEQK